MQKTRGVLRRDRAFCCGNEQSCPTYDETKGMTNTMTVGAILNNSCFCEGCQLPYCLACKEDHQPEDCAVVVANGRKGGITLQDLQQAWAPPAPRVLTPATQFACGGPDCKRRVLLSSAVDAGLHCDTCQLALCLDCKSEHTRNVCAMVKEDAQKYQKRRNRQRQFPLAELKAVVGTDVGLAELFV